MSHWAEQYLFADWRWAENGHGPREWNCWAFVREIQRRHFQRDIPMLPIGDAESMREALTHCPERRQWRKRPEGEALREGDILLMRGMDLHVAVWIEADGGGALHCQHSRDVTFDQLADLPLYGYRIERVWAWIGN